jgi:hypothetical protein
MLPESTRLKISPQITQRRLAASFYSFRRTELPKRQFVPVRVRGRGKFQPVHAFSKLALFAMRHCAAFSQYAQAAFAA